MKRFNKSIYTFFKMEGRNATFKKEVIGGLSTFLAMAYILAVNPSILSLAGGGGPNGYEGVFFLGTALSAFIGTLLMGLFANVPIALAPGMGVNAFFTFTVSSSVLGLRLEEALIATFFSGILYVIIAITPARKYLAKLLPRNIKLAIAAMIGLFLAYIGLVDSGIIVSGAGLITGAPHVSFGTPTKLGNLADPFVIIGCVVLILAFVLHFARIKGAAIIAILIGIILLAILKGVGVADADNAFKLQNYKEFSKFGELSKGMWSSVGSAFNNGKFYIAVFVFLYIDFFDTTGTLFTVGEQAGLPTDANSKWLQRANIVDAGSTIAGSLLLTSTTTSYIESSVGVSQGAKTGFSSIIVACLFLLGIAVWPIMTPILPIEHSQIGLGAQNNAFKPTIMPVTGPILVLVGALMINQLKAFDWNIKLDVPVLFITILFGMLTYSISNGIAAGVVVYYLINSTGLAFISINKNTNSIGGNTLKDFKKNVTNPIMIVMFILAIVYFATMPLYAY